MKFENVWIGHRKPLLNFIRTRIHDQSIAEDILHDVGVKLMDNLNRKTDIKNHQTWLFQVTRNTIADYYRKNKKQPEPINIESMFQESSAPCVCDLSGFIIQNYLPKKYGEPLYLCDIERKPQKEVAQTLNLSLTATKSRVQRGRKKLKELISDCIAISYNNNGQITDFQLKDHCQLPAELIKEMENLDLVL